MSVTVLLGTQWGDEGKGKVVDLLSDRFYIVARYQGGANAGHTIQIKDNQYILHLIPAGILRENVACVIGNGVVIDPNALLEEIEFLKNNGFQIDGRLFISHNAHLIMPYHKLLDSLSEKTGEKIGTTGRGIGPCYIDKYARKGIKIVDLLNREVLEKKIRKNLEEKNNLLKKVYGHKELDIESIVEEYLAFDKIIDNFITDVPSYLNESIQQGKKILDDLQISSLPIPERPVQPTRDEKKLNDMGQDIHGILQEMVKEIVEDSQRFSERVNAQRLIITTTQKILKKIERMK